MTSSLDVGMFLVGVVALIAALYECHKSNMHFGKDFAAELSFVKNRVLALGQEHSALKAQNDKLYKQVGAMQAIIDAHNASHIAGYNSVTNAGFKNDKDIEMLKVRQLTLEKKIIEVKDRTINVHLTEIKPPAAVKSKGKKDSLLERAGVK